MITPKKVRWVLAHDPIEIFLRTANRFAAEISEATQGALEIEVMTLNQYSERYRDGQPVLKTDLIPLMDAGHIEMSQTYTTTLGSISKDFHVLDLPFLFRDHDHASEVLDGEIGQGLFADLGRSSQVQGLAFTYSGGFRMIVANQQIRSVEDMKGLVIRTARSPVAEDTFKAIGALPFPLEIEGVNAAITDGRIEGGESTYPRFYSMKQNEVTKVINDTKHSLFLTTILASRSFWNSLSQETQSMMIESARRAAKVERQESIADIDVVQAQCSTDQIPVVELSKSEQDKFKAATQSVYVKYADYFSSGLIKKIQDA